jgi:hypothetical protein
MSSQQLQEKPKVTETPLSSGGSSSEVTYPKGDRFALTIFLSEVFAFSTKIWIYTDRFKIVARPGDGKSEEIFLRKYNLPPGRYFVRVDINGQIKDSQVELFSDWNCGIGAEGRTIQQRLESPTLYSAALLRRQDMQGVHYDSTFEYYTDPAVAISKMDMNSPSPDPFHSGVFIFLRYPNGNSYQDKFKKKAYWESFSLTDSTGKKIISFPDRCVTDSTPFPGNLWRESGFIGLTLKAAPGMYFLKYSGKNPRMIPIYIYENWYTQFFMTVAEEPLFGTTRIFLSSSMAFNPYDRNHFYIDMCLCKLLNNDFTLEKELLQNVAYGKFESPMLGLLGAYIYLSGKETKDDDLFQMIVNNLQTRILKYSDESPDIWALNLLSYTHFGKTLSPNEKTSFKGTPMLRIAFDAIRKAAVKYDWLIPEGSLNDHVAENQFFDSAFNSFIPFRENEFQSQMTEVADHFGPGNLSLENALKKETRGIKKIFNQKFSKGIIKGLSGKRDISAAGHEILNMIAHNEDINETEIAQRLNLPVNTVSRITKQLGLF